MRSISIRALASLLALLMLLSCSLVACDKGDTTPEDTTDATTEESTKTPETEGDTETPTEGETETPTEESTEAPTEPETQPAEKKGCGSVISLVSVALLALVSSAVIIKRKEQ